MSTCVTSFHSTLGESANYEYARLKQKQAFVLPPMFYLMSLGLVWLNLHALVMESHSATAHAHTLPNIGTFWFHFSLGLSVSLREQKDHDSIFHQGGCLGFHLCAVLHQGRRFCSFQVYVRMWAYARVWSEECRLKRSVRGSSGSPVRECSEENSADVVHLSDNSQIMPSEETAGYQLHEKA